MAWIRVTEPFCAPPRVAGPSPTRRYEPTQHDADRGHLDLTDVEVTDQQIDLQDADELALDGCVLVNAKLEAVDGTLTEIVRCRIDRCDLSRLTIRALRSTTLTDAKLLGTEFGGAALQDVVFERCTLRYGNLRGATLKRVRFEDCTVDDVDCYGAALEDVSFEGSTLTEVNVDRVKASRVDLRGAKSLGLKGVGRLNGFLANEWQLAGLVYALALATGLDIERPEPEA